LALLLLRKKRAPAPAMVFRHSSSQFSMAELKLYIAFSMSQVSSPALVQKTVETLFMPWTNQSDQEKTKKMRRNAANGKKW
jgi:hypothetical protein